MSESQQSFEEAVRRQRLADEQEFGSMSPVPHLPDEYADDAIENDTFDLPQDEPPFPPELMAVSRPFTSSDLQLQQGAGRNTSDPIQHGAGSNTSDPQYQGAGRNTSDPQYQGAGRNTSDPIQQGAGSNTSDPRQQGTGSNTSDPTRQLGQQGRSTFTSDPISLQDTSMDASLYAPRSNPNEPYAAIPKQGRSMSTPDPTSTSSRQQQETGRVTRLSTANNVNASLASQNADLLRQLHQMQRNITQRPATASDTYLADQSLRTDLQSVDDSSRHEIDRRNVEIYRQRLADETALSMATDNIVRSQRVTEVSVLAESPSDPTILEYIPSVARRQYMNEGYAPGKLTYKAPTTAQILELHDLSRRQRTVEDTPAFKQRQCQQRQNEAAL